MINYTRQNKKKALLTTVPMPAISIVNQIPGRKIEPRSLDSPQDCILLANNESFLGGRSQPAIGLHFLKENIPSLDILEFPQWEEYKQAIKRGYDIVGISFYTVNFYDAVEMVKMAREAGVKEVWAGNFGALTPGVPAFFDRVFNGCAEKELKLALENEILTGIKHPIITTTFSTILSPGARAGYLFTGRGCKFKCEFCSSHVFYPKRDVISLSEIERVLDIYKNMDINYIDIGDETFLQNRVHAGKIIDLLHRKGMKWFCTTRADLLLGHVKELKEKGFNSVYLGIESMNDKNLSAQNKGQSIEKVVRVLNELKGNEISCAGTYILGLLQDTPASIKQDLERLNELPLNILIFLFFTPYPELPLYKVWEEKGLIIDHNWQKYDGMHMVFKHPFISPGEAKELFEYAVCNIYSPYNYNKRRVLRRLHELINIKKG